RQDRLHTPKRGEGPCPCGASGRDDTRGWAMTDLSFLFTQFLGGLTTALFLFLIASGLSLVFGVLRVLNFAHGSFYMLRAYLAWEAVQWLSPLLQSFWLAAFAAALGVALLGGLIERLLLRHIYGRE